MTYSQHNVMELCPACFKRSHGYGFPRIGRHCGRWRCRFRRWMGIITHPPKLRRAFVVGPGGDYATLEEAQDAIREAGESAVVIKLAKGTARAD